MLEAHQIWKGKKRDVYAIVKRGAIVFQSDLYGGIPQATKDKIDEFVKFLADTELPFKNYSVSRVVKGHPNIYELRPAGVRILYFFFGRNVVLANGCKKKAKKAFQADVLRAENLRKEFLSED